MINAEIIETTEKEDLANLVPALSAADIDQLVNWLAETDDNFRYKCFLLLQARSQVAADVYPYWDAFAAKLSSANSYQRSLGLMLIAENARWDVAGRFNALVDRYLALCDDEKPVTVRQCVQGPGQAAADAEPAGEGAEHARRERIAFGIGVEIPQQPNASGDRNRDPRQQGCPQCPGSRHPLTGTAASSACTGQRRRS